MIEDAIDEFLIQLSESDFDSDVHSEATLMHEVMMNKTQHGKLKNKTHTLTITYIHILESRYTLYVGMRRTLLSRNTL